MIMTKPRTEKGRWWWAGLAPPFSPIMTTVALAPPLMMTILIFNLRHMSLFQTCWTLFKFNTNYHILSPLEMLIPSPSPWCPHIFFCPGNVFLPPPLPPSEARSWTLIEVTYLHTWVHTKQVNWMSWRNWQIPTCSHPIVLLEYLKIIDADDKGRLQKPQTRKFSVRWRGAGYPTFR